MRQPVRHFYDCAQSTVIKPKEWTKYCDVRITTFTYQEQSVDALVAFIQKRASGFLNEAHVRAHLPGATISVMVDETLQGAAVSRPVHFKLGKTEFPAEMYEYLIGDERTLMSTHEFNRPLTPSVFMRDAPIPMLVPFVKFPLYWIETSKYRNYKVTCTRVTSATILTLRNRLVNAGMECMVVPSMERLLSFIENRVFSAYYTTQTMFLFKNTMHVEKNKSVLDLVGVIGKSSKAYAAFASLIYQIRKTYGWVRIHGLSDYAEIHRKEPVKTTMRYAYAYNYYAPRIKPERCLLL
jgi:hypothetical protein